MRETQVSRAHARLQLAVVALLAGTFGSSFAAGSASDDGIPIPWTVGDFHYLRPISDFTDALNALSVVEHIPITIASTTPCAISMNRVQPPQQFLERIAALCKLDWYYDGITLAVSEESSRQSLQIRLNYASAADLEAALVNHHLKVNRFRATYDKTHHLLSMRGPTRYLASVAAAARLVDSRRAEETGTAVRIVRLRYAAAADDATGDPELPESGVASRLNAARASGDAVGEVVEYETELPIFSADALTNSVLVRDIPQRLDADVRQILSLDHLRREIAVDVTVADVSTSALATLSDENILTRHELPGNQNGGSKEYRLVAIVGQRGHDVLSALAQWAATGHARIRLAQSFPTQDGKIVLVSQTIAPSVPAGSGKESTQADRDNFSLTIRPSIPVKGGKSTVDLCVHVDQLPSGKHGNPRCDGTCSSVPGTFDMPHEAVSTEQALILTHQHADSTQTRIVVIVPQVYGRIAGQ